MQQLFRRRLERKSEPARARAPAPNPFACFARASSPPPTTTRTPPSPPPTQPAAQPASPLATALERISAALQPGTAQLGEVEFEKDERATADAPTPSLRPSAPGGPATPSLPTAAGGSAVDEGRMWSTPPASPLKAVSPPARRVPSPVRGVFEEEEGSTPAPPPPSSPPARPAPVVVEVEEAPPLVVEVEQAPPLSETHARTDALGVAPVTIEVVGAAVVDAGRALYRAALAAVGARGAGEAATILARRARVALASTIQARAPRLASAWAAVSAVAGRAWEKAVDWWAVGVEAGGGGGLGAGTPAVGEALGSDESTAGSAPRRSATGEEEDWEAVPPESAVGWVARE